jgi:hypothetical protein
MINPETHMRSLIAASALVVALSTAAFAQPSQGQSGAATGPTSNSATSQNPSTMGTTGAGATTGSSMSAPGVSNNGAVTMGTARNPSGQGNVGPGTDNNAGPNSGGK